MFIFSFDVESDGLYGDGFAFGAVVMDQQGREIDTAELCCLQGVTDPWVQENCLPFLADMPQATTRDEVRRCFWNFYMKWKGQCHIFCDVAYPVDASFLRQCAQSCHGELDAPYPLLDVASIMLGCGEDPLTDGKTYTGLTGDAHCPLFDARVSAHKLLRLVRENKLKLR